MMINRSRRSVGVYGHRHVQHNEARGNARFEPMYDELCSRKGVEVCVDMILWECVGRPAMLRTVRGNVMNVPG